MSAKRWGIWRMNWVRFAYGMSEVGGQCRKKRFDNPGLKAGIIGWGSVFGQHIRGLNLNCCKQGVPTNRAFLRNAKVGVLHIATNRAFLQTGRSSGTRRLGRWLFLQTGRSYKQGVPPEREGWGVAYCYKQGVPTNRAFLRNAKVGVLVVATNRAFLQTGRSSGT